jgi:hypothetical protein
MQLHTLQATARVAAHKLTDDGAAAQAAKHTSVLTKSSPAVADDAHLLGVLKRYVVPVLL